MASRNSWYNAVYNAGLAKAALHRDATIERGHLIDDAFNGEMADGACPGRRAIPMPCVRVGQQIADRAGQGMGVA